MPAPAHLIAPHIPAPPASRPRSCAAASIALLMLAGCAARRGGDVNAGLAALQRDQRSALLAPPDPTKAMTQAEKAAWAQQAAVNLEQALRDADARQQASRAADAVVQAADSTSQPTVQTTTPQRGSQSVDPTHAPLARLAGESDSGLTALVRDAAADPTTPPQPSASRDTTMTPVSANTPLVDLAAKMASLLRQTGPDGKPLLTDAAALTPIDAMKPGVLATLDSATSDAAHALHALNQTDRLTLSQARERILNNSQGVSESLLKNLRATPNVHALTIAVAALCSRVEGFGRFEPLTSSTFVAGVPARAVVYTQLAGFASRPARDSDPVQRTIPTDQQVSVDLSQAISLYHDADGVLAWQRPAQVVIETSRTRRSDFYLVQQIELPRNLTIGRYNLKITVTDRSTGAQAEHILPIEFVADQSLVR